MIVSVEVPAFKGKWLQQCIDSVLGQSSSNWHLSLLWDGGDDESRQILEKLEKLNNPRIDVYFEENQGIARARRYLSEHSKGDFILPLDDDDVLPFHAVERLLSVAQEKPWCSVIRGQRLFIDENGLVVKMDQWFPFEQRKYQHGMVTDLFNHSQPYLIRRSAYERTSGWEGFEDFMFAGEDCDVYLKLEERGTIELLDEPLYYYRINSKRASDTLTPEGAFEMWRRLADKTIERIGLPLKRSNDMLPFEYDKIPVEKQKFSDIGFLISKEDGQASASRAENLRQSLAGMGVSEGAIQLVDAGEHNAAFDRLDQPLVCLLSSEMTPPSRDSLEALLQLMHERGADLASPLIRSATGETVYANPVFDEVGRPVVLEGPSAQSAESVDCGKAPWLSHDCLLTRAEVIAAVGGFDQGFEQAAIAVTDFSLRARQRDFKCEYFGAICLEGGAKSSKVYGKGDLNRLTAKWTEYPWLFTNSAV